MIGSIRFAGLPHDDVGDTVAKYKAILELQVEAHKIALKVARARGDQAAIDHALAGLVNLQRRIRELKREAADNG